jgi:ABC-type multidrug transport system permease subunit
VTAAVNVVNVVIWAWIPIYLFTSLKRVYQQGWGMTVVKFSCIGISYLVLLIIATVFVALLSFVLL